MCQAQNKVQFPRSAPGSEEGLNEDLDEKQGNLSHDCEDKRTPLWACGPAEAWATGAKSKSSSISFPGTQGLCTLYHKHQEELGCKQRGSSEPQDWPDEARAVRQGL